MIFQSNPSFLSISLLLFSILSTTQASTETQIPILQDKTGFYVEADFGNKTHPNIEKLVPSFATSYSFFGENCFGFKDFNCSECEFSPKTFELNTPHFPKTTSNLFTLPTELNSIFWSLNKKAFAKKCSVFGSVIYGRRRSGLVGMGFKDSPLLPASLPKSFSVFMNKELTNGSISYWRAPSPPRNSTYIFPATADWIVDVEGVFCSSSKKVAINGELYFDINSDALGFSVSLYKEIFEEIKKIMGCKRAEYKEFKPTCSYEGSIKDLPSLNFDLEMNKLSIPPEIYVDSLSKGVAVLNIKCVSKYYEGKNYYNANFQSKEPWEIIILDAKFMSHFETVFNMTNLAKPVIKLYKVEDKGDVVPDEQKGKEDVDKQKEKDQEKKDTNKDNEKEKEEDKEKKDAEKNKEKDNEENSKDRRQDIDQKERETIERSSFPNIILIIVLILTLFLSLVVLIYFKSKRKNSQPTMSLDEECAEKKEQRSQENQGPDYIQL